MAKRRGNKLVVPGAENFMDRFKNEIAAELGIANYSEIDKGSLPARIHGAIGGTMTKRLIELGQQALLNSEGQNGLTQSNLDIQSYKQHMVEDLSNPN